MYSFLWTDRMTFQPFHKDVSYKWPGPDSSVAAWTWGIIGLRFFSHPSNWPFLAVAAEAGWGHWGVWAAVTQGYLGLDFDARARLVHHKAAVRRVNQRSKFRGWEFFYWAPVVRHLWTQHELLSDKASGIEQKKKNLQASSFFFLGVSDMKLPNHHSVFMMLWKLPYLLSSQGHSDFNFGK